MSDQLATYTFLPWLRQGVANEINPAAAGATRATITVDLKLTGDEVGGGTKTQTVSKPVEVYGPGDIVGIESKAIVKVEPNNWVTDFEPNYLPFIEFYDEDFPWRYTPQQPDGNDRLPPWIMLVVLEEGEFEEGGNIQNRPLPFIKVNDPGTSCPTPSGLWAWAHVHVNKGLHSDIVSTDAAANATALESTLAQDPDLGYSRIVCPRRLKEKTDYHAFLVPAFETGRLAGLGLDPSGATGATQAAWGEAGQPESGSMPIYHRWFFRTGSRGDFEYLVRLLEPRVIDPRVGTRDMDVQKPGSNISGITDPDLKGVLKLGGALKVPFKTLDQDSKDVITTYDEWAKDGHPFQNELAAFINLTDDYQAETPADANANPELPTVIQGDPDPLITAPLYARWHALTQRLLKEKDGTDTSPNDNWVHDLNLDPRFRVAAGFGTRIVQQNQEEYMEGAWQQIGDVLEANRRIRYAQLAQRAAFRWYQQQLVPMSLTQPGRFMMLAQPVQRRVVASGLTVHHQLKMSRVALAPLSLPLRRVSAPRSPVMRRLLTLAPGVSVQVAAQRFTSDLIRKINDGEVTAAPPKTVPPGLPTVDQLAEDVMPAEADLDFLSYLQKKYPWLIPSLIIAVILALILILFGTFAIGLLLLLGTVAAVVYYYLEWARREDGSAAESVEEENLTPESVAELPTNPSFTITLPGEPFVPSTPGGPGTTDSAEATRFKAALTESYRVLVASAEAGRIVPRPAVNLAALAQATLTKIDPKTTIPDWVYGAVRIPGRIVEQLPKERFVEAMAYPEFDIPMYEPLVKESDELFLPNINLIAQNSITLLETNQRFIESYMVGLNHEFGRELLWREYPTDQRGSYFRQFWDVSGFLADAGEDPDALKEKLKDIPELHFWSKFSDLGKHDNREEPGDNEEEIVLVIRGELLKKYPTAVIYAHRAKWQMKDGQINNKVERELVEVTDEANPSPDEIKTPLYEAKVAPDIYFFGFDLTADEVQGGTGENPTDDPGWFFVIKERPGEPRFGLDIEAEGDIDVWNDLAWETVAPGIVGGQHLTIDATTPTFDVTPPEGDEGEKQKQHDDDVDVTWSKDMNAAELAYMLYQVPVLVAVHGAEMLPRSE